MEKITTKKKLTIVKQYLSGLPYGEIAADNGVSKGTVANVVSDLKSRRIPEAADVAEQIEALRELSLDLRRSTLTPGQCTVGLAVLNRINECGLDASDINRWPLILRAASSPEEAQELISTIYRIEEVRKKAGLSLEELDKKVHELEKKAVDLESVARQCEEFEKRLAELTQQRDSLAREVAGFEEKYQFLTPRVKDLEKREKTLLTQNEKMVAVAEKAEVFLATLSRERRGLLELGLSLEALAEFNQKAQSIAQRRNIPPEELRGRLWKELEQLDQAMGLEVLVRSRRSELDEQERALARAKQQRESLNAVVSSLTQQETSLEATIKDVKEIVSREIVGIIPIAHSTVNKLNEELQLGRKQALEEVRQLRDATLEVGKEFGRYEQIVQANQWISELLALVRGDERIEAKKLRVMILPILRGAVVWLTQNKNGNPSFSILSYHIADSVKEIEQWKV